jgi:hypothetical protein
MSQKHESPYAGERIIPVWTNDGKEGRMIGCIKESDLIQLMQEQSPGIVAHALRLALYEKGRAG